jgi:hypothetical protein
LDYNEWLSFPPRLKTNARYIGWCDGNGCSLVVEDDEHYYYTDAAGSLFI